MLQWTGGFSTGFYGFSGGNHGFHCFPLHLRFFLGILCLQWSVLTFTIYRRRLFEERSTEAFCHPYNCSQSVWPPAWTCSFGPLPFSPSCNASQGSLALQKKKENKTFRLTLIGLWLGSFNICSKLGCSTKSKDRFEHFVPSIHRGW